MKKIFMKVMLIFILVIIPIKVYAGVQIKDVPNGHYAYDAINYAVINGYMPIDSKGNFNPDMKMNNFDVARVVAKKIGFDAYMLKVLEPSSNQVNYNKKYKGLISLYEKEYKELWDSSCNMQISYLLGKQIIKEENLAKFVIKYADGKKVVKNVKRDEVCMWLNKIVGTTSVNDIYSNLFSDDDLIQERYRQDVYTLKKIGIVNGGDGNKFSPKTQLTKSMFAALIYRVEQYKNNNLSTNNTNTKINTDNNVSVTNSADIILGVYDQKMNDTTIRYIPMNDVKSISKIESNTDIYKDNSKITINDLKNKDKIILVKVNSKIAKIFVYDDKNLQDIYLNITKNLMDSNLKINKDDIILTGNTTSENTSPNIQAPVNKENLEGVITEINISSNSKQIKLVSKNKTLTYKCSNNLVVNNFNRSKDIYSLNIGDKVKIYLENNIIINVEVKESKKTYNIKGKVIYLDLKEKFIVVDNQMNKGEEVYKVYINSSSQIFNPKEQKKSEIKDIKIFDSVFIVVDEKDRCYVKTITLLR